MYTITGGGAFTNTNISQINSNFSELSGGATGGPTLWVRPQNGGSDANPGTYSQPLATFSGTARYLTPGLTIYIEGVLFEQVTLPIVNNVTVIGVSVVPRQATTSNVPNGGGATWLSPLSGISNTTALVTVQGQGWTFQNILFNNSATSAGCVKLSCVGDPPLQADASQCAFINCRFTGANLGIDDAGGAAFTYINGCEFFNFTGTGDVGIKNTSTSLRAPLRWVILNSYFWGNVNNIIAPASGWIIKYCVFNAATTAQINFTGGTAPNFVQQNAFAIAAADFDPAGGVTGVTGDVWSNYLIDAVETGLPANEHGRSRERPMPTSALDLLTLSYIDCGIIAGGESLTAEDGQQGLTRLNNMVSGWRTQYGTVTAIERTVFPLVADQQTYTIGVGGNFNVPKPNTIAGAALWLSGLAAAVAVTSITRSGYTATVTQATHGYAVGDEVYINGATEIDYNGLQTIQTVPTANTFTYTLDATPATPANGTITTAAVDGQPIEIPRPVITDSQYQGIAIKNLPNPQFTNVYYNPTSGPFGTIFLYPKPSTAANQLILYLQGVFGGFATLTTQYDWPNNAGYAEAIQYQLDKRLLVAYPRSTPRIDVYEMANETFGLIKRANNKINDVNTDASLLAWNPSWGYNINSDQGGGGGRY